MVVNKLSSKREEAKLLKYTYILVIICFINLSILKSPIDVGALVMAGAICLLIGYSYFVIRKYFPDGDKYIFIFSGILSVIGIVMIYRLDIASSIKQVIWFAIGVTGFIIIVVTLPDLKRFGKYKYVYLVATLIFMTMPIVLGVQEVNGSKNWIRIAGFSFQPSEFGKLFLVAYLATALKEYKHFKQLIEPAIVVMVSLGFMVLQKDLGSALILFGISITMLYIATSKLKYIVSCIALFCMGAVISYKLFDHVRTRILIWQDPWPYADGKSYQVVQSMFAIASGGLTGTGLGLGSPKYVPVNTSDFIFSVICEEMGVLIGFGIIIIYFLLFYRTMRAAIYGEDGFSKLLVVGYSAMIASQVLVIIGGVMNMIPLTGVTLPLVSYGGTSMLVTFFSLGIIQKISEEGR